MADDSMVTDSMVAPAPAPASTEVTWTPQFEDKEDTATVYTFDGKKLPTPLTFTFKWREIVDDRTLIFAKQEMTLEEQRNQRNADAKLSSRQKGQQVAFKNAGLEKDTAETSDKIRAVDLIKNLMTVKAKDGSRKYDWESAKAKVLDNLDIEWDDQWGKSFSDFEKKAKK